MTASVSSGRLLGLYWARTGDAQVGLASSVHSDAQADGGCALMLGLCATGRLSELAGVRVCDQRRRRWPWGAARGLAGAAEGCFGAQEGTEVGVAEQVSRG